jgi:hypothetical protein
MSSEKLGAIEGCAGVGDHDGRARRFKVSEVEVLAGWGAARVWWAGASILDAG